MCVGNELITSPEVEAALRKVDRGDFTPNSPYMDSSQSIGMFLPAFFIIIFFLFYKFYFLVIFLILTTLISVTSRN